MSEAENVIFFDFDGVGTTKLSVFATGSAFALDPTVMRIVQNLCKAANAKLVCSSNRAGLDKKDSVLNLLTEAGFDHENYLHDDWSCSYQNTYLNPTDTEKSAAIRTENINRWRTEHPEVKNYVAFDDLLLKLTNLIHIRDKNNGLKAEHIEEACALFRIEQNAVIKAANPKAPRFKFDHLKPQ